VNLLAGKKIVSEHIQKIDVPAVANEITDLIHDDARRQQMLEQFRMIRETLQSDAASRAAAAIAAHAGNSSPALP
jgi:lipid A disaccharide synthetase